MRGRRSTTFARFWILALLIASATHALDPELEPDRYVSRMWTVADGLPQNGVLAVTQDERDYLFLGTRAGLARFDGVRFVVFDKSSSADFEDHFITSLAAQPGTGLWVGTREGLLLMGRSGIRRWGVEEGLPEAYVRSLLSARDGALWIGTYGGGLVRREGDQTEVFGVAEGLPDPFVRVLLEDAEGGLWAGTSKGLARYRAGRFEVFGASRGLRDEFVRALALDSSGCVVAGTNRGSMFRFDGEEFVEIRDPALVGARSINALHSDRDGLLWIATDNGLLRLSGEHVRAVPKTTGETIWSLFEDREGSLWVGGQGGLIQLKNGHVTTHQVLGTGSSSLRTVAVGPQGEAWMGSDDGALFRLRAGGLEPASTFGPRGGSGVRSLAFASDGALWVGTETGAVAWREGRSRVFDTSDGLPSERVNVMDSDPSGTLFAGTSSGLARWTGVGFEPVASLPPDLRVRSILAEENELWIGSEGGLYRFRDDEWQFYSVEDGLPNNFVLSIHRATDDTIWLGTAAGLGAFEGGDFKTADAKSGFPPLAVYQILEDQQRGLWLCTAQGIWRIDREDQQRLLSGADGQRRPLHIAESEGMASRECNGGTQPAGARLPDGRLAFPTVEGLVVVDPERLRQSAPSPAAVIERLNVDGLEIAEFGKIELAPGRRSLALDYTAPSFLSAADIRFRYLLEGFHEDWVPSGSRRKAFFTNLDAGAYKFRVAAALQDGAWGDEAVVLFVIRPFLHERIWFWPLLVGIVGFGFYGTYRKRISGLKRRQSELESVVRERTRELRSANEKLEELVLTDGLTQLSNYRSFQEEINAGFGRAQRRQRPLALAFFDIDYFKGYNDTWGHAEGDRCLQKVAAALASAARRGGEVVARYGGEEFAVLLPELGEAAALELAEGVRASIEALEIANPASGVSAFVTVSAGIASIVPSREQTPSILFELADNALYDAKHDGRNRVAVRRDRDA